MVFLATYCQNFSEFVVGRIFSQRPHHAAKLVHGDEAVAVVVEQLEGLAKLLDLLR